MFRDSDKTANFQSSLVRNLKKSTISIILLKKNILT